MGSGKDTFWEGEGWTRWVGLGGGRWVGLVKGWAWEGGVGTRGVRRARERGMKVRLPRHDKKCVLEG